ncbi:unnamed protein product [Microthlaspi erraticum]|uniref:Uncharacterized protein n=1 Tax=Microthlaspi erraticum TaxID=1685480 RepID=A0A6D2KPW3_9BRAS|nr:unnamed protein product [Microthlaspi erraticum]
MDFIKTSSLRALIELTFQRNWNGLIWMSRKGVTTKRVKTVQTALSRNSAQPRSPAGRGTNVPRSAKVSVRLKSRPKSKPLGRSHITTRETLPAVGQANARHTAHDQSARAGNKPRGRATVRVPRPMHPSEPGKNVPRPAENFIGQIHPSTTPADRESIRPDRSDSPRPDCPADRPDRPSQRRGRPEALLKPKLSYFQARLNPKPPLERPSTIYIFLAS